MKYALTLNFESKEALLDFLSENESEGVESTSVAATAAKKKGGKKKDALEDVKLPEAPSSAPLNLYAPQAAVDQSPIPVQAAPVAPVALAAIPFDRNMILANINATINEKTTKGVPSPAIAKVCADIFLKMGLPVGNKIGTLDDSALYHFNNYFVVEIENAKPLGSNNFI